MTSPAHSADFPWVIGDDPLPGVVLPTLTLDFQSAAVRIYERLGSPSHATIAGIKFNLELAFSRYCSHCWIDRQVGEKDERARDLRRGYGPTHNALVWHLETRVKDIERRLPKNPELARQRNPKLARYLNNLKAFLTAEELTKKRDEAEDRARIKKEHGADIQHIVMPRDRRKKKIIGSRPMPGAARALDFPVKKTSLIFAGRADTNNSGPVPHVADYNLLIDMAAIGKWLVWPSNEPFIPPERPAEKIFYQPTRQFPRWKFCVEEFLRVADPGRFNDCDAQVLAHWKKPPSRKFYRDVAAELAKNGN